MTRLAEEATVAVGSGNHDLTSRNSHGEKAADWIEELVEHAVVDWSGVDVDDVQITVCPWWDGPLTRDDLGEFLAKSAEDRPKRWVWLYHSPPDESSVSWAGSRHIGDQQLNQWIDRFQPDLVLAGHIHNSPFVDGGSWLDHIGGCAVLNVGAQPGPIPPHAFLDLTAGTAEWWSSYGRGDALVWSDR